MEIEVGIGNEEQQKQIVSEIQQIVELAYGDSNSEKPKYLIPIDFDQAIIDLTSQNDFNSSRKDKNHLVLGKTITEKSTIVINPVLFNSQFDLQIRATIYLHEYFHFTFQRKNVDYEIGTKIGEYISFLNFYFEENSALIHGVETTKRIFDSSSEKLSWFLNLMAEGHYENLKNRDIYHLRIINLIQQYKYHNITLENFLNQIFPIIRSYTVELLSFNVYSAGLDFKTENDELFNDSSRIICSLLDEYQTETFKESDMDRFLRTFGLSLEDQDEGLYWAVDFINKE